MTPSAGVRYSEMHLEPAHDALGNELSSQSKDKVGAKCIYVKQFFMSEKELKGKVEVPAVK